MLIRYLGSKDKHLEFLAEPLAPHVARAKSICEPFAGTAAVTFHILSQSSTVQSVWLNDIDPAMASLWRVIASPAVSELIDLIESYVPQAPDFYDFKQHSGDTDMQRAFRKIVLHQISYSGLGAAAGSPMGGRNQTGPYLVGSRWRPDQLVDDVNLCAELFRRVDVRVTSMDFADVLPTAFAEGRFVYLDPPYFKQGKSLYLHGGIDHVLLASLVHDHATQDWLMSYDAAPEVYAMYADWADLKEMRVRSHVHHRVISDVVILPREQQELRLAA
jgi:DNA adenine methylase